MPMTTTHPVLVAFSYWGQGRLIKMVISAHFLVLHGEEKILLHGGGKIRDVKGEERKEDKES